MGVERMLAKPGQADPSPPIQCDALDRGMWRRTANSSGHMCLRIMRALAHVARAFCAYPGYAPGSPLGARWDPMAIGGPPPLPAGLGNSLMESERPNVDRAPETLREWRFVLPICHLEPTRQEEDRRTLLRNWGERPELNRRPPDPQSGALTD